MMYYDGDVRKSRKFNPVFKTERFRKSFIVLNALKNSNFRFHILTEFEYIYIYIYNLFYIFYHVNMM